MPQRFAKETFALTGGTPTTDTLSTLVTALRLDTKGLRGVPIDDGRGVTAVVTVDVAAAHDPLKTIVSGNMRCYSFMPVDRNPDGSIRTRRWVKYPALDVDLIADTKISGSTEQDIPLGDKMALSGTGRLIWLPDAVVGSSGTDTLTVTHVSNRWGI